RRFAAELVVGTLTAADDRQAHESFIFALLTVIETMTACFPLCSIGARIAVCHFGARAESHTREMKIFAVAPGNHGVRAERLDAVNAMYKRQGLRFRIAGITHRVCLRLGGRLRPLPAGSAAVQEVGTD